MATISNPPDQGQPAKLSACHRSWRAPTDPVLTAALTQLNPGRPARSEAALGLPAAGEPRIMPLVQFSAPSARKIIEIANEFEPVQDGRIHIENINRPMLFELKATPAEYRAGLHSAIAKAWLMLHESGAYVRLTETGASLFA